MYVVGRHSVTLHGIPRCFGTFGLFSYLLLRVFLRFQLLIENMSQYWGYIKHLLYNPRPPYVDILIRDGCTWFHVLRLKLNYVNTLKQYNQSNYLLQTCWSRFKMVNHRAPLVQRKVYVAPRRPFEKARLDQELKLIGEYGLRNKREVWRVKYTLAKIRKAARELLTLDEKDQKRLFEGINAGQFWTLWSFGLVVSRCSSYSNPSMRTNLT